VDNNKVNWKKVITLAGACVAFSIGAGFASGQELIQYYSVHGWWLIPARLVGFIVLIYGNYCFAIVGNREKITGGTDAIRYYCGKIFGGIIDYFMVFYCYMSAVVMFSGAGSTLHEQYGIPIHIGAIILAALSCITVVFGLDGIINVISKIGPILVGVALILGVYGLVFSISTGGLKEGMDLVSSGQIDHLKASESWFLSGVNMATGTMLWFAGFMAELGSKERMKDLMWGQTVGLGLGSLATIIVSLAFVGLITEVVDLDIPFLYIARMVSPAFASFYTILIFLAMYTSNCPLLWTASVRFFDDKSMKFKVLTVILTVVGYFIAMAVPYQLLMNYVWVIGGYVAMVVFVVMLFRSIYDIYVFRKNGGAKQISDDVPSEK